MTSRIHPDTRHRGETRTTRGRACLERSLSRLPPETVRCLSQHLQLMDFLCAQIATLEQRIDHHIALTPSMQLRNIKPIDRSHDLRSTNHKAQVFDSVLNIIESHSLVSKIGGCRDKVGGRV
jgi:hypothetical protein